MNRFAKSLLTSVAAMGLCVSAAAASAKTITYEWTNASFWGGSASVTGTFVYDTATQTILSDQTDVGGWYGASYPGHYRGLNMPLQHWGPNDVGFTDFNFTPNDVPGWIADFHFTGQMGDPSLSLQYFSLWGAGGTDARGTIEAISTGAGGVPEPATWSLMLLGFGGLGMAVRSRRRTATAQA